MVRSKFILASLLLLAGNSSAQLLLSEFAERAAFLPESSGQFFSGAHTPDLAPAPEPHVVGPHHLCNLPEEQYSGYLGAGTGASYFFWLARSVRERGAGERPIPLLMWLSGGPGCSSTFATLLENGPCRVDGRGSDGWHTHRNPFSWTEEAHVLWVDQPAGVGFSGGRSGMVSDESGVADRMHEFLGNFFDHFGDLAGDVPFFIFGESFGGHYVPAIAAKIVHENSHSGRTMNLQGMAVGNGLTVPQVQFASQPEMACTGGSADGGSFHGVVDDATCQAMRANIPNCREHIQACEQNRDTESCNRAGEACGMPFMLPILATGRNPYDLRHACPTALQPICLNLTYQTEYLNDPEIQASMGVQPTTWIPCNMAINAAITPADQLESYGPDVAAVLEHGVRVMLYYGDTDYMCDWIGGKAWVTALDWPQRSAWASAADEPFVVHGEQKGRVRSLGGLSFLQMFHSGHLVPADQPEAALAMVREFVSASSEWAAPTLSPGALRLSAGQASGGSTAAVALAVLMSLSVFATLLARRSRTIAPIEEDAYLSLQ